MATEDILPTDKSQKLILVAITVIVIAAFVERYSGVKETATVSQIFIGAFVAGALLLLLSFFAPEFAVGLAVVAMIGMIIGKGQPFWDAINTVVGTPNSQTPKTPTAGSTVTSTAAATAISTALP